MTRRSARTDGTTGRKAKGELTVLKLGGELIESPEKAASLVSAVAALVAEGPLVIVHGGGKDIDIEAARRGLSKQTVDGLRITDGPTLEAVVAALAGTVNTRLVGALSAAGIRAVGLTGADALVIPASRVAGHRTVTGTVVDLGLVGEPSIEDSPALLLDLLDRGYVPVLACLGCTAQGEILNINADTLAADVARACRAGRLIVGGATAGVLDADGTTIERLDVVTLDSMIADGRASAGMVAKLRACRSALESNIAVSIVDGRAVQEWTSAAGTRLVPLSPSLT
ncbi:MAG: acetylglutamate kinase [Vicinamibacterales bacterium]